MFLSRWLRHVPRERLLVLHTEDYIRDKQQTILQVPHVGPTICTSEPTMSCGAGL